MCLLSDYEIYYVTYYFMRRDSDEETHDHPADAYLHSRPAGLHGRVPDRRFRHRRRAGCSGRHMCSSRRTWSVRWTSWLWASRRIMPGSFHGKHKKQGGSDEPPCFVWIVWIQVLVNWKVTSITTASSGITKLYFSPSTRTTAHRRAGPRPRPCRAWRRSPRPGLS